MSVVTDRDPAQSAGVARTQFETLDAMGVPSGVGPAALTDGPVRLADISVVVDALVGYGLSGSLRDTARDLVETVDDHDGPTVSLDVPAGMDATTGERPGTAVRPDRFLTLALPKTGLVAVDSPVVLADIGIPAGVYDALDIPYDPPFGETYRVELDAR